MPGQPFTEADEWTYQRVRLCQLFTGWTFKDVDDLTAAEFRDIWAVIGAQQTHNKDAKWFS